MDLRSHAIALISVIVALGLAELLGRLNALIQARDKVRWHALPLAWAAVSLVLVNNYWWGLYLGNVHAVNADSAASFLLGLVMPVMLYLLCASALPRAPEPGDAPVDLGAAYFAQRRYFFGIFVAYVVSIVLNTIPAADGAPHITTVLRGLLLAAGTALFFARAPWVHVCGTLVALGVLVARLTMQVLHG